MTPERRQELVSEVVDAVFAQGIHQLQEFKIAILGEIWKRKHYNNGTTSRMMGIARNTLVARLKKYCLKRPDGFKRPKATHCKRGHDML